MSRVKRKRIFFAESKKQVVFFGEEKQLIFLEAKLFIIDATKIAVKAMTLGISWSYCCGILKDDAGVCLPGILKNGI